MSLILVLFIVCQLMIITRRNIELVLPPVLLTMMPLLGVFACFYQLTAVSYLLGFIAILLTVYIYCKKTNKSSLLSGKQFIKNLFTPSFVALLIAMFIIALFTSNSKVFHPDEYRFYAFETKMIYSYNGFASGAAYGDVNYSGVYADYMPGLPLLLAWITSHCGHFNESILYLALNSFHCIMLLPLFTKIKWKQWYLTPAIILVLLLLPFVINPFSSNILYVDTLISFIFGYLLILLLELNPKSRFDKYCLLISFIGIIMLKEGGFLSILFIIAFYFILGKHKIMPKKFTITLFLSPLFVYGIWRLI